MTLTSDQIAQAARDLIEAERTQQQIGHISQRFPQITMDDAYAIQGRLVEIKREQGLDKIGWKIGLTSKAMQDALKIDIPDSGVLLDDMLFDSGVTISKGRFIQPRIEAEIAFVMKSPLAGEDVTREDVIAATDYVTPAIEILDTRVLRVDPDSGETRKIYDTIADNAANAGIVRSTTRHDIKDIDLRWVGVIVKRDGVVEETGLGAGVLDDPVEGIVWLAHRMALYGETIRPGEVILAGSFIRPLECPPGSRIEADFGSFGSIDCCFK